MSIIKVMNINLSNKIAAGEVIEKCVSIVKELVENSIDASSKNIKIELIESGTKEIKVVDDGNGMEKDDVLLAFQRHATSKLYEEEDLYRISSLGFRGEALPSISSVSNIIMKSSTGGVGTEINVKGGEVLYIKESDSRKGTTVIVRDLFYNVPARLKHMSSLYTELSNIVDFVNKIALSHPYISFELINDSKTILNTDGSNNQLKVISKIYGIDITKKMIKIEGENDDYSISGYISYPEITKSNRNHIITLVNGRVVKNIELNRIINENYYTYKPEDRYPIIVLNIEVDSSLIDVNIHPTKQDIKFSKMEELKQLITSTISNSLSTITLIPKVNILKDTEYKIEETQIDFVNISEGESQLKQQQKEVLPELYPVGLVKGTYIVCQNELGMYLIDQHAANERINYEYYKNTVGKTKDTISSLFPVTIKLPHNEYIVIKEHMEILKNYNFLIEEFGVNTFIIREHPIWLPIGKEEEAIRKILDILVVKEKEFDLSKITEKIAISLSCKLSIKANENISFNEMETLIDKLRKTNNPYTCPHGRPTIIFYSFYELEKLFKRVV